MSSITRGRGCIFYSVYETCLRFTIPVPTCIIITRIIFCADTIDLYNNMTDKRRTLCIFVSYNIISNRLNVKKKKLKRKKKSSHKNSSLVGRRCT